MRFPIGHIRVNNVETEGPYLVVRTGLNPGGRYYVLRWLGSDNREDITVQSTEFELLKEFEK